VKSNALEFFDSESGFTIVNRKLPHWTQSGTLCFVTWRAADSLPHEVCQAIDCEVHELLNRFSLAAVTDWRRELANRPPGTRSNFARNLLAIRDKFLDEGHGRCLLSNADCARVVERSLLHFDGDRYLVTDIVVMPNHIHFIAAFQDENSFLKQCTDWKRYTARQINRLSQCRGEFWQVDQFDHLIRNEHSFEYFRRYIAKNPEMAKLRAGQFRLYSRKLQADV